MYTRNIYSSPVFKAVSLTLIIQSVLILSYVGIKNSANPNSASSFQRPIKIDQKSSYIEENKEHVSFNNSDLELNKLQEIPTLNINPELTYTANSTSKKARVIKHKVTSGETLSSIWSKYAKTHDGALLAAEAFKSIKVSHNSIRANEIIEFQVSAAGDITGLKKQINEGDSLILRGNSESGYQARVLKANIVEKEKHITAYIYSSLAATAHQQGVPYGIIDELVDIFGDKIDFRRQVHPGDSFSVVYSSREFENGRGLNPGPVKAASIKIAGKMIIAVRHVDSHGKVVYYDKNGEPLGSDFLRYPLQFTRISSVFSDNRLHPVLKIKRPHHGVDFAAPIGTPVRTIGPGIVEIAGWHGGGGKTVKIKHNARYATTYLHLSSITAGLRPGSYVEKGQIIGKVGMTGLSSGPHLHFGLFDNNRYVDPMKSELPRVSAYDTIPVKYLNEQIKGLEKAHQKIHLAKVDALKKIKSVG